MASSKVTLQPPSLTECKTYESYKRELKCWAEVTDLPKSKQGSYIILSLPNKCKFGDDLREKALESIDEEDLSATTGLDAVLAFLDKELAKNAVDDIIDKWEEFDNCSKQSLQSMEEFISDFESKYNRVKQTGTTLPEEILAYMLMKQAGLGHLEKMLILSRVDIEKKDDLFKDVKMNMKNILGKRMQENKKSGNTDDIKIDAALLAQNEEVLATYGYYRNRSNTYPKSKPWSNKPKRKDFPKRLDKSGREINPSNRDGKLLLCNSCGSYRHLQDKCPDSHENRKGNILITEHSDSNTQPDRFVLFTSDKEEISKFTLEARNCAALDTCCTTTVAGKNWIKMFLESLPLEARKLVKGPHKSDKVFKGVGKGTLPSIEQYTIPAEIGECPVLIQVDIIDSDIPMLLSKSAMKKAKMVLHMDQDFAEVMGKHVMLNTTSAGHYVVPLLTKGGGLHSPDDHAVQIDEINALHIFQASPEEKYKALEKLHKQFGHRPKESFNNLLKTADCWSNDLKPMIDKIIDNCEGCIKRRRNPDRPSVTMPMASDFNEKIAMDLSFYKGIPILHHF